MTENSLFEGLKGILGSDNVTVDEHVRLRYSLDLSEIRMATAAIVVWPKSTKEVSQVVKAAHQAGYAVVPRGAGMSYTLGYVPKLERSVLLCTERMNRVETINTDDLYITVEVGATWAKIRDALQGTDYEIPFLGTASGLQATVGGGLGNNATGHGQGDIADHVLGIQVVLPNGDVLETGGRATGSSGPLSRNYGPDLTGLFVHDGGAFGVKTKVTFKLARRPGGIAISSFGFRNKQNALTTLIDIAKEGLATNLWVFGGYHHVQFMKLPKPDTAEAKNIISSVYHLNANRIRGLIDVCRMLTTNGVTYLSKWPQSLHIVTDGHNYVSARSKLKEAKRIAYKHRATSVPAAFMIAFRGVLFNPIERLSFGPEGECSFPSNCVVPLSQALSTARAIDAFFKENSALIEEHHLKVSQIYLQNKRMFGIEPIIFWRDKPNPLRQSIVSEGNRQRLCDQPEDSTARAAAIDLRKRLIDLYRQFDCAHFQIGKYYPYHENMKTEVSWSTLVSIKDLVDPDRLMNPGALGLE